MQEEFYMYVCKYVYICMKFLYSGEIQISLEVNVYVCVYISAVGYRLGVSVLWREDVRQDNRG